MDKEFKDKWVAALRGGEYKQGKERLRTGDCFCCLGVALNLIDPQGWVQPPAMTGSGLKWKEHWAGDVLSVAPTVGIPEGEAEKLAHMNDGAKGERIHTFPEIADYIESNL